MVAAADRAGSTREPERADDGRLVADLVLRGCRELLTLDESRDVGGGAEAGLGLLRDAALAARDGEIVWTGPESLLDAQIVVSDEAFMVDAGGGCALPGFVDCHTHAVFAGSRAGEYGERLAGRSYADILAGGGGINETVRATREATQGELEELTLRRLDTFMAHGTTTLEIKSGYGLTLEDERKQLRAAAAGHPARRRRTFLGAHFVPPEYAGRDDEYIDLVVDEMLPALRVDAGFCDVFCDQGAFTVDQSRRVLSRARELGYGLRIHADELARSGGALLAAELGCLSADHLVHATNEEIVALRAAGVVAVLLPGTSFTLRSSYAPARAFLDAGLTVALASDFNPGTCYCENLQMAIALACQEMRLTPAEAIRAATVGGAAALGMQDEVGSLAVGKRCDVVVLDTDTHHDLPYHFGVNLVDAVLVDGGLVVQGGRCVWGDGGGHAHDCDCGCGEEETP